VVLGVGILLTTVLALGASMPGDGYWTYMPVFRYLPGWEALRTPGRLILWITLALALLAAGALTRLAEDERLRRAGSGPWRRALLLVPAVLVLAEGVGKVDQPVVPTSSVALRTLPGPVLVLPTSQQGDFTVMTWSTSGWPLLANGGSGFEPPGQSRLRLTAQKFPSAEAVQWLRAEGIGTVVLDRSLAVGTSWAALAAEPGGPPGARAVDSGVGMRNQGDAVIYDLTRSP
jgi:hypothetical protein